MSGTETLLPHIKEKKTEQQQPTIIVDSHKAITHARRITESQQNAKKQQ